MGDVLAYGLLIFCAFTGMMTGILTLMGRYTIIRLYEQTNKQDTVLLSLERSTQAMTESIKALSEAQTSLMEVLKQMAWKEKADHEKLDRHLDNIYRHGVGVVRTGRDPSDIRPRHSTGDFPDQYIP